MAIDSTEPATAGAVPVRHHTQSRRRDPRHRAAALTFWIMLSLAVASCAALLQRDWRGPGWAAALGLLPFAAGIGWLLVSHGMAARRMLQEPATEATQVWRGKLYSSSHIGHLALGETEGAEWLLGEEPTRSIVARYDSPSHGAPWVHWATDAQLLVVSEGGAVLVPAAEIVLCERAATPVSVGEYLLLEGDEVELIAQVQRVPESADIAELLARAELPGSAADYRGRPTIMRAAGPARLRVLSPQWARSRRGHWPSYGFFDYFPPLGWLSLSGAVAVAAAIAAMTWSALSWLLPMAVALLLVAAVIDHRRALARSPVKRHRADIRLDATAGGWLAFVGEPAAGTVQARAGRVGVIDRQLGGIIHDNPQVGPSDTHPALHGVAAEVIVPIPGVASDRRSSAVPFVVVNADTAVLVVGPCLQLNGSPLTRCPGRWALCASAEVELRGVARRRILSPEAAELLLAHVPPLPLLPDDFRDTRAIVCIEGDANAPVQVHCSTPLLLHTQWLTPHSTSA